MNEIEFQKGDIVSSRSPKITLKSLFTNFVQWLIRLCTTDFWRSEHFSYVHHTEMVYGLGSEGQWLDVTMEPPCMRLCDMGSKPKVAFRLKEKPIHFDTVFDQYCKEKMGQKYDFVKFFACGLDWIFHTTWFTRHITNKCKDICSEMVARFYEERVGIACSMNPADATKPDDINDYCRERSDLFQIIVDFEKD